MAKGRRGSRKNMGQRRRTRRAQRGGTCACQRGGDSAAYSFGSAVAPGAPYASEVIAKSACQAVPRPGELGNYSAPSMGGLPGFGGGGRRRRNVSFSLKNVKRTLNAAARGTRKFLRRLGQRGGRYTMDTAAAYASGPNVFLPATRIPCEGSTPNPLNPGPHTPSSQPPLRGGARRSRAQHGGVGGVDSAAYYAPTAGYSNQPSTWVSSTGTPSLLQIPYEAKAMNPACLKTGGGKRRNRKRGSRRHR